MNRFSRLLSLFASFLLTVPFVNAQVTISEFMASNSRTLADEDGDYPDWVELFNTSSSPVSLENWSLTDDKANLTKWRFPSVTLNAKGFLVVFASGKDRKVTTGKLHTNFSLNADGEYLALVKPDGTSIASQFDPAFPKQVQDISYGISQTITTNRFLQAGAQAKILVPADGNLGTSWTAKDFNDSSWSNGMIGAGYETSVPGFSVRYFKANSQIGSLTDAERVIATPSLQSSQSSENAAVINYFGSDQDGHYADNKNFPGAVPGTDIDDFAIEATATITVPSAGSWTFGVNSDDGFGLTVGPFSMSWAAPRGPTDTLAVFNFPAAGDYNIRLVYYERGGGSSVEFFAAKGNLTAWDDVNFRLVGDTANGGLTVKSAPVAGSTPGATGYRPLIRTDLQSQMAGKNASAYLRIPFVITNTASLQSLILSIQYDDGFIASVNGQEVARRNAPSNAQWNSAATASHAAATTEEINISTVLNLLTAGTNILAIQGLNQSSDDSDFLIAPELLEYEVESDVPHYFSTATPGSANSAGFFAFVQDTKFSQDRGFYDAPFDLAITTETADATIRYTTNGIPPTATTGFIYTGPIHIAGTTVLRAAAFKAGYEPSNADTQTYVFVDDVIHQAPTGQAPSGWPTSWGGNIVNYGMDPDVVNNPLYSGTIKNDLKTIPSFSIVMDLKDLFDSSRGIYANPGQDGRDWERPASVELIYPDGTKGFQINAGLRIRGGFSRSTDNPKHAFRFFFREEYGASKLKYPLFGDAGTDTFDAIDLRTFQNYSWSFQGDPQGVFIRDQFSRDSQLAMGQQGERGNYYHLYINGQYWGLYNTCERPEASFGATYFGGEKEDYDVIKVEAGPYNLNATDGTMAAWTRLYNMAKAGLSTAEAYQKIQGNNPDGTRNPAYEVLLDVPNMIDYMLTIIYGGNLDAPISNFLGNTSPNNWYGLRNRTNDTGFRFIAHDSEHTLLNVNEDRTGPFSAGDDSVLKSSPQYLWKRLQPNLEFRMLVADHIQRQFFNGGAFTPEAARARFLERKDQIDRAVVGESARWGDSKRSVPLTRNDWLNAVNNILNNYFPQRTQIVLNQLKLDGFYPTIAAPSFNQFGGNIPRGFNLTMSAAGTIYYTQDGSDPRLPGGALSSKALIYNAPLSLNETVSIQARALSGTNWSALNQATFTVIQTFKELLVTEIMYNPPSEGTVDGDDLEFIELKNVSPSELDLSGVHFTNGIAFTFPDGTILGAGKFAVLVSNPTEFQKKYPGVAIAGTYTGHLSNSGERLTLVHAVGTTITSVQYADQAPWPSSADGNGFSLVPANPNLNPNPDDPANWRASTKIGGSPGTDNPPSNAATVWINEILANTDSPQVDSIELYNPTTQPADISYWFLTDDRSTPKKYQIPAGTTIPAGGYRVFSENDFNRNSGSGSSFTLNSHGEEIYLYSADASGNLTGYSDGFSFDATTSGMTLGRYTISTGETQYPAQSSATLGSANAGPAIGPVVINEIQYDPTATGDEFIELKNITTLPVRLYDLAYPTNTWKINGIGFDFPSNTQIPANGLLLVVGSEPSAFRTKYNVPTTVAVLGPFPGVLQDNGELIQLQRPDSPEAGTNGTVFVPYIDVDAVRFNDKAPWPTNSAGTGSSIERINPLAYGNDPINWRSSPGPSSPGLDNNGNRLPQVNAGADLTIQSIAFPVVTNLVGTAIDDGQPQPPGMLSVTWSQVSGPGNVTFGSVNQAQTTVSFPGVGDYTLRLIANDGELSSSDDMTVSVERAPTAVTLLPAGSIWKYLDDGSNQGTAWRNPTFNDSAWRSGKAELGYGDGDEATTVQFGPDGQNRYPTTYFRTTFQVSNAKSVKNLTLRLVRDDGAIVYLNGTEAARSNMPEGDVNYLAYASSVVGNADESAFFEIPIDPSLLKDGSNLLAVELHQANANSSDISFNAELTGEALPANQAPIVDAGAGITASVGTSVTLNGSAVDDGLPIPPGKLTITWSKASGPGIVTFADATNSKTTATFSATGDYTLRLTATDGESTVQDDVSVTVSGGEPGIDAWKARYFTAAELANPAISGDNADPDGDGHTNIQEYEAGTNPRNVQDVLKVQSAQLLGATSKLTFQAVAGKSYTVQYRDSLDSGNWLRLADVSAKPATETATVTDTMPRNGNSRYYRIVTPQQP